jgi:hypothetical protein
VALLCLLAAHAYQQMEQSGIRQQAQRRRTGAVLARIRAVRGAVENAAHSFRRQAGLGSIVRIDFFATGRGCVFNEFSSTPWNGEGFTAFCDDLFGGLWAGKFPSAT